MFQSITMDFITDLPPSMDETTKAVYDFILVIVDRYSKVAKYIPCRKNNNAKELAEMFIHNWFENQGLPASIVTDRGALFTSNFWSALCYHLNIKRRLSTAYHPQTDGQTERQNQTLETYLRLYTNHHQDNWVELLPMALFAYHNAYHDAIKTTPNKVRYGINLEDRQGLEEEFPGREVPLAKDRAKMLVDIREKMNYYWAQAKATQTASYNARHKPQHFNVDEEVLLSTKNLSTNQPKKSMEDRRVGPFKIVERIGQQAYRLALPKGYKSIHDAFHVSLLEPYQRRKGESPPPAPEIVEGEERYYIEEILDHRVRRKKDEYLVKWEGYSSADNQWIKPEDFDGPGMIEAYHKKYPKSLGESSKRRRKV
jgi:hypothetical protein